MHSSPHRPQRCFWRAVVFAAFCLAIMSAPSLADRQLVIAPTRSDVASAYLEFEEAYAGATLSTREVQYVHRAFDHAAAMFFSNQLGPAIRAINALTWLVHNAPEDGASPRLSTPGPADQLFYAIHAHFSPRIIVASDTPADQVGLRLRLLYPVNLPKTFEKRFTLELKDPAGKTVWGHELPVTSLEEIARPLAVDGLSIEGPGSYSLYLQDGARKRRIGRLPFVAEEVIATRTHLAAQLEAAESHIETEDEDLLRAARIARARLGVLAAEPSPLRSIEFLLDRAEHAKSLASEITAIRAGENPYRGVVGEHWRVIQCERSGPVPLAVYAPKSACAGEMPPMPLVIALHGAGGDEMLFMRAYGAGMVRDLAEEHGFVVASPRTYDIMNAPGLVDQIIGDISTDYAIDLSRIYLIGHSLGASTLTLVVANRTADTHRVAAAVCIAGAGAFEAGTSQRYPPVLVIAAELDTLITPARLRSLAEAGVERGLPIEFRLRKNMGHVLVVNDTLPEAVEWLLLHRAPEE